MNTFRFPSLDIPEVQKRAYSEAEVHSTLFEPDMLILGYPSRTSSQADGAYFSEQRTLAVRRLKSQQATGRYDGLYLVGNSPVVLCEIKRYDALDAPGAFELAKSQLLAYAQSDDFAAPPPFLILYCGKASRNRFFRLKSLAEPSLLGEHPYEELTDIWSWERIRDFQLRGEFAQEIVDADRLREILLHHLNQIEESLRVQVAQAIGVARTESAPPLVGEFGKWLLERPEALSHMRRLYDRKVAEIGSERESQLTEELVTQAALNYLNKVFFLSLCEDRHLPGFYRIMREFLPRSRAETTSSAVAVFLTLLRRRIKDTAPTWDPEDETAYRTLRQELAPAIQTHVIEQNSWRELIQVAFDLAAERFPLIYREDAFDYFRPGKEALAELVYDLSTKSFEKLTNRHVGDIYQSLLSARRRQQSKLGAFYTPHGDVEYMVSRLGLTAESRVLDPCMGSGHFLEELVNRLVDLYAERGVPRADAFRQIVERQLFGADIDSFALSLAAIRLFLMSEEQLDVRPHLYVHDMLLHTPERQALFTDAERVVLDDDVDAPAAIDAIEFDAVVGNPPYGARKPRNKRSVYGRLYGANQQQLARGSLGTSDHDSYAMFFANGLDRLRDGGRLCLITNDSFRTLTTYARLRRHILDRCKIVEILLTDTRHFEGVSFQFAGMAITTLERCGDAEARQANLMRLVDYVRDPMEFASPPAEKVHEHRQEDYEALPETPFFVGVPRDVLDSATQSERVRDVARGRQGLATADDARFLAPVGDPRVTAVGIAAAVEGDARTGGIRASEPFWVRFAKGEGFGEYWRLPGTVIDWSEDSVAELARRARLPVGTPRRPRFQNRDYYFRAGLNYSVVSSGRVSARLMPEGWIFGHKGSAIFVEDERTSELFLLAYLNTALATYFMKKLVNSTATADVGYVEKLPYRRPSEQVEREVVDRVRFIVDMLKADPTADIAPRRADIDEYFFDLFEIGPASREEIRRFYRTVGLVEQQPQAATE